MKRNTAKPVSAPSLLEDELLTAPEAAAIRRKTVDALRQERYVGTGPPFIRDAGVVLYPRRALEAWLADRLVTPDRTAAGTSRPVA